MSDAITETCAADTARIAAQNDAFRRRVCLGIPHGEGDPELGGQLVCTAAVNAVGIGFLQGCLERIGRLDHFPPDSDPDGRHDFGAVEVFGTTVWFKLDLYDAQDRSRGSEAPEDPARTWRVLTVLFPSDW